MNTQCRILYLLLIITIAILIYPVKSIRSNSDQQSFEHEQHSDSDLSGQVLELSSINDYEDIDTYIQPSFYHYDFHQSLNESHQFANSQNLAIPKLISGSDETLLERHKRDVTWIFDTSQTLAMDGSGTFTEDETTELTTQAASTSTTTMRPPVCTWTNWVPLTNCTPSCGSAQRREIRSCIDFSTGLSCHSQLCGGGNATRNISCTTSPPCPTLPIIPQPSIRDPQVRITPYLLPDPMYFFEQTYQRIW
ncbi:unnamed protein product, partial [Adineta ricciae]